MPSLEPEAGAAVESVRLRARYSETDQMRLVYHTHYLVWCEIARTEYMRQAGLPYSELEAQGTFLAVAEASIRYHAAARYDDPIRVDAWIERARSRTVTFGYTVWREGDRALRLASATTTLVAMDVNGGARSLPASLVRALEERAVHPPSGGAGSNDAPRSG